MRVIVVLVILTLALIGTVVLRKERESSFDYRFEQAEKRIEAMSRDIDKNLGDE
ncbi:hypothetical protein GRI44_05240 [Altererythrobacter confluentis]|uniref:Uncharacterized protein n=1 Tax=Allopontixanthobacter confluentis TaxID=1849021 RepID=A0A6L7GDK7_9SPHN|nr:hypothetical protein [Allopontixanthobacter confluentis]MXP14152.1 hypothetical protein [Allopontixanthobacter confluentis]